MKKSHTLSLLAIACSLTGHAHAFVTLTGMTPNGSPDRINTSTAVLTLSDASNTYSSLVGPTEVSVTSGGARFQGSADSASLTANSVLLGNDLTTAVANPSTVRILFGRTITNRTGSDIFITEIGTSSQSGDPIVNIRAIIGGTITVPVYSTTAAFTVSSYAAAGAGIAFVNINNGSGSADFNIRGFGLDLLTDLGESSIIGIEFSGNGVADPNLVLAAVPEPSAALLAALGTLALLRRKR